MNKRKGNRKQKNQEKRSPKYTLLGEGLTEMYYFKHLNSLGIIPIYAQSSNCRYSDIQYIEKKLEELLEKHTNVVCVFDADQTIIKPKEGERLKALIQKYKDNKRVLICNSMPSIEYWFLLHYTNKNGKISAKDALKNLQEYIPNYDKTVKFLRQEKWVADMLPNLDLACQRAKDNTNQPSYTNVYKIFEQQ